MNTECIKKRLATVLPNDELHRLKIENIEDRSVCITANVHKLKCHQARRLINNVICLLQIPFKLTIIHGYNHGTAIKDMLSTNYTNKHITKKYVDNNNPGITHMLINV